MLLFFVTTKAIMHIEGSPYFAQNFAGNYSLFGESRSAVSSRAQSLTAHSDQPAFIGFCIPGDAVQLCMCLPIYSCGPSRS